MTNHTDHNETLQTPRRGRATAVAFTVIGLVIAGAGTTAAAASAARFNDKQSDVLTADVAGISQLDLESAVASLRVVFADTDVATLDVQSTRPSGISDWSLQVTGDTVTLDHAGSWWSGGSFFGVYGEETLTLTLPRELDGRLQLELDNSAGDAVIEGDFVSVEASVSAGDLQLTGAVTDLDLSLGAGSARLDVADVDTLDVEVSAGSVRGAVTGSAPTSSTFEVSAGDVNLEMPDETYRVNRDVSFGDVSVDLATDSAATRTITIEVSAGDVTLRRGE